MAIINSIISAIGNNNSIYPLLVRDCGIENPIKVYKTYNQNKDDNEIAYLATRERLIDEYATSAVWLGGIPLIDKISNYFIRKKAFSPDINIKLYKEEAGIQGLQYNINKFKNIKGAEEAVKDLEYVLANKNQYKKLQGYKFLSAMVFPIALMGFVIPKAIFALTANTRAKKAALEKQNSLSQPVKQNIAFSGYDVFDKFILNNPKQITFKGGFAGAVCNLSTVDKMAITDGGYALGRIATARKKNERIDLGFKMLGMMYLNFVAPKQIDKLLTNLTQKIFNMDVNLDPTILGDKRLKDAVVNNTLKLPASNSAKDLLDFVDNLDNSKGLFIEYAQKFNKIKMLDCGVRDPRAYVDIKELGKFRDDLAKFTEKLKEIEKERIENIKQYTQKIKENPALKEELNTYIKKNPVLKYIKTAKAAKTFNILANVGLSSYLLACVLPEAQFAFREWITGSKLEPGLIIDDKKKKN